MWSLWCWNWWDLNYVGWHHVVSCVWQIMKGWWSCSRPLKRRVWPWTLLDMLLILCVRALQRTSTVSRAEQNTDPYCTNVSVGLLVQWRSIINTRDFTPFHDLSATVTHVHITADSGFAQPPSESEDHSNIRPHSPPSHSPASPGGHPKPLGETIRPKEPPSPAVYPDKARGPSEAPIPKRSSSLLNSFRPPLPLQAKEGHHSVNGRTKPWDSFTPEEFAQQFHESVLQSTQKALQKHKGGSCVDVLFRIMF